MSDKFREEFEKVFKRTNQSLRRSKILPDQYEILYTETVWQGWKMAAEYYNGCETENNVLELEHYLSTIKQTDGSENDYPVSSAMFQRMMKHVLLQSLFPVEEITDKHNVTVKDVNNWIEVKAPSLDERRVIFFDCKESLQTNIRNYRENNETKSID